MDNKMKVLVVDDEPDVIRVIGKRLEMEGFEVSSARGGKEALAAIASGKPDAVLLDIHMPDMAGVEVLKEIRRSDQRLPVFFLTADPVGATFEEAKELNASGFILKTRDIHGEIRSITSAISLSKRFKGSE
ncbi:MAG: response regulator [Candidatus Omnitrophica bacterium]|nr:response regulator [Candidatus Omnitrophota bacterium]